MTVFEEKTKAMFENRHKKSRQSERDIRFYLWHLTFVGKADEFDEFFIIMIKVLNTLRSILIF